MAKTKLKAEAAQAAEAQPLIAFKGFNADWTCRDFQFEVGKTYEHDGNVEACAGGFHACEYPLHVLRYYKPATSSFAIVEQSGAISRHDEDSKIASQRITVKAEIDITGLIKAAIKYTMDRCTPAEGAHATKANESAACSEARKLSTASGNYGAATASGNYGKARGKESCVLFLVYRDSNWKPIHAKAAIVGQDGIKPDVFYTLDESGNFKEA